MIRNVCLLLGLALALPLAACGDDGSDGDTGATVTATATDTATDSASASASESASDSNTASATDSDTASATASASESNTESDSASESASESASASDSETTTTGGAETTGGADTSSGGGENLACEAAKDDDACSMCLKTTCCDQLQACRDDSDCDCILDCLEVMDMGAAGLAACQKECAVVGLPPAVLALSGCQAGMCEACNE